MHITFSRAGQTPYRPGEGPPGLKRKKPSGSGWLFCLTGGLHVCRSYSGLWTNTLAFSARSSSSVPARPVSHNV